MFSLVFVLFLIVVTFIVLLVSAKCLTEKPCALDQSRDWPGSSSPKLPIKCRVGRQIHLIRHLSFSVRLTWVVDTWLCRWQATDLANQIHQKRDLGCKSSCELNTITEAVQSGCRGVRQFWKTLGSAEIGPSQRQSPPQQHYSLVLSI